MIGARKKIEGEKKKKKKKGRSSRRRKKLKLSYLQWRRCRWWARQNELAHVHELRLWLGVHTVGETESGHTPCHSRWLQMPAGLTQWRVASWPLLFYYSFTTTTDWRVIYVLATSSTTASQLLTDVSYLGHFFHYSFTTTDRHVLSWPLLPQQIHNYWPTCHSLATSSTTDSQLLTDVFHLGHFLATANSQLPTDVFYPLGHFFHYRFTTWRLTDWRVISWPLLPLQIHNYRLMCPILAISSTTDSQPLPTDWRVISWRTDGAQSGYCPFLPVQLHNY